MIDCYGFLTYFSLSRRWGGAPELLRHTQQRFASTMMSTLHLRLPPHTLNPETLHPYNLKPKALNPETLKPLTLNPEPYTSNPEILNPKHFTLNMPPH